jgi:hypothetical protein
VYAFVEFLLVVCVPVWTVATLAIRAVQSSVANAQDQPAAEVLLEQSMEITSRVDALERALNGSHLREEVVRYEDAKHTSAGNL